MEARIDEYVVGRRYHPRDDGHPQPASATDHAVDPGCAGAAVHGRQARMQDRRDPADAGAGHRFVMGGRGAIGNVLYMATLSASRFNKPVKAFMVAFAGPEKPPKAALTACMTKLLTILNAMVRDGHSWRQTVPS